MNLISLCTSIHFIVKFKINEIKILYSKHNYSIMHIVDVGAYKWSHFIPIYNLYVL